MRRFDQAAPEGGMAVGVEAGAGQIVMGVAIAAHHVIGRRAHGDELGIARQRRIVGLDQVDQAQRLGGKAIGQIKARQGQPRLVGVLRHWHAPTAWVSLRSVARKLPPLAWPQCAKSR